MLLPIYYLHLSPCPKLSWLVLPRPCHTSLVTVMAEAPGPSLLHTVVMFFLPSMAESPSLLPCICLFLLEPRRPPCTFCPAISPWPSLLPNQEPIGEQDFNIRTAPFRTQVTNCVIISSLYCSFYYSFVFKGFVCLFICMHECFCLYVCGVYYMHT